MSKLWAHTDCASPTSHGSLRFLFVITSEVDLLGGLPLSFCKPSNSLGRCAFPPWGRKEGTCFRLVPLAPHEMLNLQQCCLWVRLFWPDIPALGGICSHHMP